MKSQDIDITTQWLHLGIKLIEDIYPLQIIKANHPNDASTCCHRMFQTWLERSPDASWSQLITALKDIKMNTAAHRISKLLKSST